MSSLSGTRFLSLPRWDSCLAYLGSASYIQVLDVQLQKRRVLSITSRNAVIVSVASSEAGTDEGVIVKKKRGRPRKETVSAQEDASATLVGGDSSEMKEGEGALKKGRSSKRASSQRQRILEKKEEEKLEKESSRGRKNKIKVDEVDDRDHGVEPNHSADARENLLAEAGALSTTIEEEKIEKSSRRRRKSKSKDTELDDQVSKVELTSGEGETYFANEDCDNGIDLQLEKDDADISFTYGWPPLVCCFGAAQHAFLPSGRPSNRLLDYEFHSRMKDALWAPEKFVRAPGGSAGSVAIALAGISGKVAFMGKLGDDDYGQTMLYYLNVKNVQTRCIRMDSNTSTAVSNMKIGKQGRLRMTIGKQCAEDSLLKSEIDTNVLKEARMFYCNTSSLLDQNMRETTLKAIEISKKSGGIIFFDLNLPLPLWHHRAETKDLIQEVWNLADVIEVTKQELEFLCDINPTENFYTEDNDRSKFVHYKPEVLAPLFHEQLKVLFVTNGTSKIHYYTKEQNGAVHGMEDPPITPFTCDMSAAGDSIVAALMRMLVLQPHLITDKVYIERSIKYAISCGVTSQWLLARQRGFPPKEGLEEEVTPDPNGIISLTERQYRTHAKVPTR